MPTDPAPGAAGPLAEGRREEIEARLLRAASKGPLIAAMRQEARDG